MYARFSRSTNLVARVTLHLLDVEHSFDESVDAVGGSRKREGDVQADELDDALDPRLDGGAVLDGSAAKTCMPASPAT
jgi:hypothetical protein